MRQGARCSRHLLTSLPLLCLAVFLTAMADSSAVASPSSESARRSYERGVALFREGNADGAIDALKKALAQNPKLAEAY
ncbi:MAG: tetratricopeptide repeat protein, partial [Nitrospira sp.]|nr:tetratricopeptide repeat protein [Nitrospira sp.]